MALHCQVADKLSAESSSDTTSPEEPASLNPINAVPGALSRPKNTATALKKHNSCNSAAVFASKKGVLTNKSRDSGDYLSNSRVSITDLPSALVSKILHCLDPKDLGVVCCVSTVLQNLAYDHHRWKDFYCERWGSPLATVARDGDHHSTSGLPGGKSWKDLFVEREHRSKSFMGRFSIDSLSGHTEAVRAVCLLQSAKLAFTGGYDSIVRIWDMEEGLGIVASQPLGCTIRAIAVDAELLVVGGTDAFIQCWKSNEGNPHLFDIAGSIMNKSLGFRLWGHQGPITCLDLDRDKIYSGSWDMSVRVWDRINFDCISTLRHGDWVSDLVSRGSTIASSTGNGVHIWDTSSGNLMGVIHNADAWNTCALARSHLGDLLFTGGDNGDIHMFEVTHSNSCSEIRQCASWKPHGTSVHSLAFEFPWLVSCSSDGRLALIDVRKLLKSARHPFGSRHRHTRINQSSSSVLEPPQRMLHGSGNSLFAVAIGADRIICGGDEGVVKLWNFSQALEIEERVHALRRTRLENRMRRRRVQIEINSKRGPGDQAPGAAMRSQKKGYQNFSGYGKRREHKL